jgi:hypothetical protein
MERRQASMAPFFIVHRGPMTGPTSINPLLVVTNNVPERIKELREERDRLVRRVLEISHELAKLETILVLNEGPKPRESPAHESNGRQREPGNHEFVALDSRRSASA